MQRENNTVILLEKTSWRERDPNGTWDDGEALERKGEIRFLNPKLWEWGPAIGILTAIILTHAQV